MIETCSQPIQICTESESDTRLCWQPFKSYAGERLTYQKKHSVAACDTEQSYDRIVWMQAPDPQTMSTKSSAMSALIGILLCAGVVGVVLCAADFTHSQLLSKIEAGKCADPAPKRAETCDCACCPWRYCSVLLLLLLVNASDCFCHACCSYCMQLLFVVAVVGLVCRVDCK